LWQAGAHKTLEDDIMIIGAHIMIQSANDAVDKAFLTDVLKLTSVDAGGGFLIFGVPPAEIALHESDKNGAHELFLMCDDIEDFVSAMKKRRVAFTPPQNRGWGTMTQITLPGGGMLGVYQPHHKRPKPVAVKASTKKKKTPKKRATAKKASRTPGKKKKR
jgi:hypothetical protein